MASNPAKSQAQLADRFDEPMIGDVQAHIADAVVAHALNSTFSDTEVEAALDALGVKINSVIAVLESHGFTKDA